MDENQEKELKKEELTEQPKEVEKEINSVEESKNEQSTQEPAQENKNEQVTENQVEENIENDDKQENNELVKTKKKKDKKPRKGSFITGTLGGIFGGAVAAIAWIAIYFFAEHMVIPILGTLIPMGAFLGYKIFNGKIGKQTRVIITIISLILIILITTILCPSILLIESGYPITLENLTGLYSEVRAEVREVIIEDLIAGLLFTIVGIVAVIIFGINKKLNNEITEEQTKAFKQESRNDLKEKSEIVKKACQELNAMNSENAVSKKIILKEIKKNNKLKRKQRKQYFTICKLSKLLVKHKGKYYYDENDEESKIEQAPKIKSKLKKRGIIKTLIKILIIALIITGIVVYYLFFVEKPYFVAGTNIELDVSDIEHFYGTPEKIKESVGEEAAKYYEFIIDGKDEKYELYGQVIPKIQYEDKDFATIIQQERDYYAPYIGEDVTSQVEDKQLGDDLLKSYNYTTTGTDGNQYRSIIYLYEAENSYLWINVYTYYEIEVTQIDNIIDKLIK